MNLSLMKSKTIYFKLGEIEPSYPLKSLPMLYK